MAEKRIDSFQAFRAIAFIGIFLSHVELISTGSIGVSMFLVLSGFLMAWSYSQNNRAVPVGIKNGIIFSAKKMKKLYPLHILTLILMSVYVFAALCKHQFPFNDTVNAVISFPFQLVMMQSWLPVSGLYFSFNKVSWYLSVCMFSYALFPSFFRAIRNKSIKSLLGIGGGIVLLQSVVSLVLYLFVDVTVYNDIGKWVTYICPAYRVCDFFIGCILALLMQKHHCNISCKYMTALELLYIVLLIGQIYLYTNGFIPVAVRYDLYWLPTSLLGVFLFYEQRGLIVKLLTNKVLVGIGNISAQAFLLHQIIIGVVEFAGFNKFITAIIAFIITVFSAKVYVIFESYCLKRIRRC